ncbi:MAG: UbiD family decarboxylase [Thermoplasmatales archaeon]
MRAKPKAYSIRSYIEELKNDNRGDILEIEDKVSLSYETTAYYLRLRKKNQVLLFNNLEGYGDFSLVTNIYGSEERVARLAGFSSINEVIDKWSFFANEGSPEPLVVSHKSDVFPRIITGEDLNLFNLPIPSHYENDGSKTGYRKYITSGITTTRDPENESVINLSFARIQPFKKNKFAFDAGSHGHLWKYLNVSKERGEPIMMTILVGPNPIFYLLAASFIDNEFGKASKIFNIDFSQGHLNDVPIPSDTEIAIEAEFLPKETFDEGPFAEYVGYVGYDSTKFVAEVKSILMKKNPIYYDIQPSNSSEHVNLFSIPRSSLVMRSVREALPKGPDYQVKWPPYGGRFISFGYVDKPEPGFAKQLGISILGSDPLWNKLVFINEGRTELCVENALINMAQEKKFDERNVVKISEMFVISSDPTRDIRGNSGKIVFITHSNTSRVEKQMKGDKVIFKTRKGNVLISHENDDDYEKVNVIVPDDIDIRDPEQIGWAIATRSNPDTDIEIEKERVTFLALRKVPPVASIPKSVKEKIEKKLILLPNRFH